MPFEIGNFINGGAGRIGGSPLFGGILRNPVFTSLVITALAMVIIFAMFGPELRGAGPQKTIKLGFWLMLGISAAVFLHYYVVDTTLKQASRAQLAQDTVTTIYSAKGGFGGAHYPVLATSYGGAADGEGRAGEGGGRAGEEAAGAGGDEDAGDDELTLVEMPLPATEL